MLYEMSIGRMPFAGNTSTLAFDAILHKAARGAVKKALEMDPNYAQAHGHPQTDELGIAEEVARVDSMSGFKPAKLREIEMRIVRRGCSSQSEPAIRTCCRCSTL